MQPWQDYPQPTQPPKHIIIIGAGIAGCASAFAFAKRGIKVDLIERHNKVAAEASGNPQGLLYAKFPLNNPKQEEFHLAGLNSSLSLLETLNPEQTYWQKSGLLQLAYSEQTKTQQKALLTKTQYQPLLKAIDATEASKLANSPINLTGVLMAATGWLSPAEFCRDLVKHPLITLHPNTDIKQIEKTQKEWRAESTDNKVFSAPHMLICSAAQAKLLAPLANLPIKAIRGQISIIDADKQSPNLTSSVSAEGYIAPAYKDKFCFGASFDLHRLSKEVRQEDHQQNLQMLKTMLPELGKNWRVDDCQGRVSFRCSSPDYLPLVGIAPEHQAFVERYAKLRQDKNWRFTEQAAPFLDGLYLNLGHGSKGFISAPLCAEIIVCQLCNEPLPISKQLLDKLSPARFVIRDLIRRAI